MRVVDHTWIPTRDGTRLAARIWLPESAGAGAGAAGAGGAARIWLPESAGAGAAGAGGAGEPVPALLEYIPYRKNDATAFRDAGLHAPFAERGFASVRVDLRGSGDSEGILEDEYSPTELADGLDVIEWLSSQPWCNGSVGMFGKSWGGFNALQVAALRPPALKAIITVCSSDDRYGTDVHYMGGALLASEMLSWATTMLAMNARPPDPLVLGEAWRGAWLDRMERTPWYIEEWLSHQVRDDYWRHGSVGEDYSQMDCAVLAVGGWADPYCDTALRLLEGYAGPCKAILGPWAHFYPNDGIPGPGVDFIEEASRWWRRWLLEEDNDVMDEPDLRVWLQDTQLPEPAGLERAGRFVGVADWRARPSPQVMRLAGAGWGDRHLDADLRCGSRGGRWYALVAPGDLPGDQRGDDAYSACLDTEPLSEDLCLVGFPDVALTVASCAPDGQICVRLCDVSPEGPVALISVGVLNLTHRSGDDVPEAAVAGEPVRVRLRLRARGYRVRAGHRLRVAVSAAYWPWLWPSPSGAGVDLRLGEGCELSLPVIPESDLVETSLVLDDSAKSSRVRPGHEIRAPGEAWRTVTEDGTGRLSIVDRRDADEVFVVANGLSYRQEQEDAYSATARDPLSAFASTRFTVRLARPGWDVRVEANAEMSADAGSWLVTASLDGYENERRVFGERRSIRKARVFT